MGSANPCWRPVKLDVKRSIPCQNFKDRVATCISPSPIDQPDPENSPKYGVANGRMSGCRRLLRVSSFIALADLEADLSVLRIGCCGVDPGNNTLLNISSIHQLSQGVFRLFIQKT